MFQMCYSTLGGATIGITGSDATAFLDAVPVNTVGQPCSAAVIEEDCAGGLSGLIVLAQLTVQQPAANNGSPTWLPQAKVFVSALGQNFINEFKPNGCFAQFASELATGQAANASPPGAGPEDVVRTVGQAAAATYAVSRGLAYPMKSSVYRSILGLTETAAAVLALAPFDYEAGKAFVHEMQSLAAGTCR